MKLSVIILIATMMHVSASSFGQKITLKEKEAKLTTIFKQINAQSGYFFLYDLSVLDKSKLVTIDLKNASIQEVLEKCFEGQNLTYKVTDKAVVVQEKSIVETAIEKIKSIFSTIDVTGRIVDEDGKGLAGATVKVKGSTKSVLTNQDGEFSLKGIDDKAVLIISYTGYDPKEVAASANFGSISMSLSNGKLQEVEINAGYYKVSNRELTGSIARVSADVIGKQPVSNPLQALQGRVSGLEITQLTGVPGGGFKVQIRGQNSIAGGNDPLYIIDGVVYPSIRINNSNSNTITQNASPLSMISPNDIESIEILKDADATAIYGSRGANGVMLITTKKGIGGLTKVSGSIFQGIGQVGHRLDLMNTQQYLAMRTEAFKNDKLSPSPTDYDINGVWDKNKYTDWQDLLIGGAANTTNASFNISSGNKDMNYLVSGNYYSEGTVFPGDFGFKRGGLNSSMNFGSVESRFHATLTTLYSHTVSNLLSADPTIYITMAPNAPDPYDQNGNLSWKYNGTNIYTNPLAILKNTLDANTDNLIGNANLSYRISKGLVLSTSIGYTLIKRDELAKRPLAGQAPVFNPSAATRTTQFGNNYNKSWIAEPQLSYKSKLGLGNLDALVGMSFQQNTYQYRNIRAAGFNGDDLMEDISGASTFTITESSYTDYKYVAGFGRLNYNISDKYYLNLTGRRDGSSRFGPGKQFANFGAIGASWIFSEEKIIKENLSFLSFGKLRASYGVTGNDQIPDYGYLQLFTNSPTYQGTTTLTTSRIANPDYSWETNRKTEAAIQLGFLRDRINLQLDYFRNRSSNQLIGLAIPPSVGPSSIQANLPATVQNTGWEFEGTLKIVSKKNWNWTTSFNLTIPKNKLVAFPGLANSSYSSTYILNQPLSVRRYYDTSVNNKTGLYVFEDTNGNGVRDDADLYLNKFIGQIFYGGFQNSVRYKQFNLDFLFSFSKQNGSSYLNGLGTVPGFFSNVSPVNNQPTQVLERWENPGDQSSVPKFTTTSSGNSNFSIGKTQGTQSIADDSYIRMKNIALSYSFPKRLLSRIRIHNLELNLQGQNVFTITKYKELDPENQFFTRLPPLRVFSLGLKFTL